MSGGKCPATTVPVVFVVQATVAIVVAKYNVTTCDRVSQLALQVLDRSSADRVTANADNVHGTKAYIRHRLNDAPCGIVHCMLLECMLRYCRLGKRKSIWPAKQHPVPLISKGFLGASGGSKPWKTD